VGEVKERRRAQEELINLMTKMKLSLIAKYGPNIKKKWSK
jgi:hypothetical protein